jgi:hypothetical protein
MGETWVPAEGAEVIAVATTTTCELCPAGPATNADAFGDTFAQQDISNEARQRERKHANVERVKEAVDAHWERQTTAQGVMHFIFDRRERDVICVFCGVIRKDASQSVMVVCVL